MVILRATIVKNSANKEIEIRELDAKGRGDHLFNEQGIFYGKENNDTCNILVNNKLLTSIDFSHNLGVLSKIITHYFKKVPNSSTLRNNKITVFDMFKFRQVSTGGFGNRFNSVDDSESGAFEQKGTFAGNSEFFYPNDKSKQIVVFTNGGRIQTRHYDNYYNVISALVHENTHTKQLVSSKEYKEKVGKYEIEAYLTQVSDSSWVMAEAKFRRAMLSNIVYELKNHWPHFKDDLFEYINRINACIKEDGELKRGIDNYYRFESKPE